MTTISPITAIALGLQAEGRHDELRAFAAQVRAAQNNDNDDETIPSPPSLLDRILANRADQSAARRNPTLPARPTAPDDDDENDLRAAESRHDAPDPPPSLIDVIRAQREARMR